MPSSCANCCRRARSGPSPIISSERAGEIAGSRSLHCGKCSQQQIVTFDRDQISHGQHHQRVRLVLWRRKHLRIDAVVENGCVHRSRRACEHLFPNFLAYTNHPARRAVNRSRYPSTPSSGVAFDLPGREGVQSMHRDHERYFQFPAEQRSCVAAGQSGMRVNQVHRMRSMQTTDFRKQPGKKKAAGAGETPSAGKREKAHPSRRSRRARWQSHVDRTASPLERCCSHPTEPATAKARRQSNPEHRPPAQDRTASSVST